MNSGRLSNFSLDRKNDNDWRFSDEGLLDVECKSALSAGISAVLAAIGSQIDASGTSDTPKRVANMYDELLSGYSMNALDILNDALFDVEYDQMVVVKGIDFYSLCEHHMLPFYGKTHVGYLPNKKVIGLSKVPRLVEMFARRLQVQERMTQEIAATIDELVSPKGVGVVIEAHHLCASMRGIGKPGIIMTTSAVRGTFKTNSSTRDEFMSHLSGAIG